MKRAAIIAAIVAALAFGLSQALIPPLIGAKVADSLERALGNGAEATARVSSRPALRMLFGEFDSVRVAVRNLLAGDLRFDTATLSTADVSIPLYKLPDSELGWTRILGQAKIEAVLMEADINAFLALSRGEGSRLRVQLEPGHAIVAAEVVFMGREFALEADGAIDLRGADRLVYDVESLKVDGQSLPGFLVDLATKAVSIGIDISRLPLGIQVTAIGVEEGVILLTGHTSGGGLQ